MSPDPRALADLVRLPAVVTVPGDVLTGHAVTGDGAPPLRQAALVASSSLLYLAGMALNDWADREIDAVERPGRPIPSGRISADAALRISAGLTGGGLALASAAGRRPTASLALTGAVWLYDLGAKGGGTGPATMATARALNVFVGAAEGRRRAALPAALITGLNTLMITKVSASEVQGGTVETARSATAATALVTAATTLTGLGRAARTDSPGTSALLGTAFAAAHAASVIPAQREAADRPSARNLGRVVGTGILGMIPLQASALASSGRHRTALAVGALWPAAKQLAAKRSVT